MARWLGYVALAAGLVVATPVVASAGEGPWGGGDTGGSTSPEQACADSKGRIDSIVGTGPGRLTVDGVAVAYGCENGAAVSGFTGESFGGKNWRTLSEVGSVRVTPGTERDFHEEVQVGAGTYGVCLHVADSDVATFDCFQVEVGVDSAGTVTTPVVHGRLNAPLNWGNGGAPQPSCGYC